MKMDGTIHVQISKEYDEVYNSLKKGIGIDSHILFFLCFCIAVSKNLPLPLRFFQIRFYRCLYNSSLERKIHLQKIKILVYYAGNILTVVYINNTGEMFLYCGDRNEVAFS